MNLFPHSLEAESPRLREVLANLIPGVATCAGLQIATLCLVPACVSMTSGLKQKEYTCSLWTSYLCSSYKDTIHTVLALLKPHLT